MYFRWLRSGIVWKGWILLKDEIVAESNAGMIGEKLYPASALCGYVMHSLLNEFN